ncbi:MAG: methyltransferase type 11 [Acidobacteria bacterium]|nr:MAG: methyltransferase type 11 [Acidobacteriota bacterium]
MSHYAGALKVIEKLQRIWRGLTGRETTYPHELAFILTSPLRNLILSPAALASRLSLEESDVVLEIGPGPGYFSSEIAQRLPQGRLELFDLQPEMLKKARRRIQHHSLTNAGYTAGDATRLPYRDGVFDRVFLVAVLGEVPDHEACLQEAHRVLKADGQLSITEQPGDPDFIKRAHLDQMAARAGFEPAESFGRGLNYTANYGKA